MPATNSRRGRIWDNLQRQLQTITVANGYQSELQSVRIAVPNWVDIRADESPLICIIDDVMDFVYHPGKLTERIWTVNLFGIMKGADQDDMEVLLADIEDCLFANVTLSFDNVGPVCSHIRIRNIVTDKQQFYASEGSQLFKVTITIHWTASIQQIR